MKNLYKFINEQLLIESDSDRNFINTINDIINNTDSFQDFNKKCERLKHLLDQYKDVNIEDMGVVDIEKGAVYCTISQNPNPSERKFDLEISFGMTGGSVRFFDDAPSFVENKCIVCEEDDNYILLMDCRESLTKKDVISKDTIVKKIGKSPALKKFLTGLRKQATKW